MMSIGEIGTIFFITLAASGAILSVFYTLLVLYKFAYEEEETEERVPLLDAAKLSVAHVETPIFGEAAWFVMIGWACIALALRAGWHNSVKLVMQLEWKSEDSDQEFSCITRLLVGNAILLLL